MLRELQILKTNVLHCFWVLRLPQEISYSQRQIPSCLAGTAAFQMPSDPWMRLLTWAPKVPFGSMRDLAPPAVSCRSLFTCPVAPPAVNCHSVFTCPVAPPAPNCHSFFTSRRTDQPTPWYSVHAFHGVGSWHNRLTSRCSVQEDRHQVSDWVDKVIHTQSGVWSTLSMGLGRRHNRLWACCSAHRYLATDSHPHSGFLWGPGLGPASQHPLQCSPSYKHPSQCSQVTQLQTPPAGFTSHPATNTHYR